MKQNRTTSPVKTPYIVTFLFLLNFITFHKLIQNTNIPFQPDGRKLFVLLTFYIVTTPIWRFGKLASREASIDYSAL